MKVTDLTIDEFKKLIKEAVDEKFKELLFDPDDGLELRGEIEQRLKASLVSKERIPLRKFLIPPQGLKGRFQGMFKLVVGDLGSLCE